MEISTSNNDSYSVVKINGKIDAVTSPDMQEAVLNLIDEGKNRFIIDFNGVDYISSAGLQVLLTIARKLHGNGKLAIFNPQENVRDIIEMTGLVDFMAIYENFENAEAQILS